MMEIILRDVPLHVTDAQVCEATGAEDCIRFRRTAGARSKPLNIVRAFCKTASDAERLLSAGSLSIDGHACPVELPKASSDSSAAAGKRPAISLDELVQQYPVVLGSILIPGASDSSNVADEEEESGSTTNAVPRCYCCKETSDYRRVASMVVRPHDVVLEIGSDLGLTCAIAWPLCGGKLVGVDLSETSVATARQAYPNIQFEVLDALQANTAANLRALMPTPHDASEPPNDDAQGATGVVDAVDGGGVKQREESVVRSGSYTVFFIDINGNRPLPAVLSVLQLVLQEFRPRLVCVKSRALHATLSERRVHVSAT